jgi:Vitamin K-dependent gamma-carboxylase
MNNDLYNRKIGVTIFRIMIGILVLKDFISYFFNSSFLFGHKAIVTYGIYVDITNYFNLNWLCINFNNNTNIIIFCVLGILFSISFLLGVFTRLSAVFLFFLLFIFKIRALYMLDGADNVISVMLPFFVFLDSYCLIDSLEKYKLKIIAKFEPYVSITGKWFSKAMILQICVIYFFASFHKLQGDVWLEGTALYYILNSDDFSASSLNAIITSSIIAVKFFTWFTILFQFAFPFLVWFKKTKYTMLLLGISFHIGIFILMRIDNFSFIMLACYSIFLTDNEYENLIRKIKAIKIYKKHNSNCDNLNEEIKSKVLWKS